MKYQIGPTIPVLEEGRSGILCGTHVEVDDRYFMDDLDIRQTDGHLVLVPKEGRRLEMNNKFPPQGGKQTTVWNLFRPNAVVPEDPLPVWVDDLGGGKFYVDFFRDP